jgi:hypothetical protein
VALQRSKAIERLLDEIHGCLRPFQPELASLGEVL